MNEKSCRLCSTLSTDAYLDIFSERGVEMEMADILCEHFKCDVSEPDPLPNVVCQECWAITKSFHDLYQKSKEVQEKFLNSLVKDEPDPIEIEAPKCDVECNSNVAEIAQVKMEVSLAHFEFDNAMAIEKTIDDSVENNFKSVRRKVSGKTPAIRKQSQSNKNNQSHQEMELDKEKTIQCDICNEMFSSQRKLVFHRRSHEKDPYDKELYDQFIAENFDMKCDQCDESFNTFDDARRHYKEYHSEANGWIKCCGKKLRSSLLIRDHIKKHLNPEQFKCELCSRSFQTRAILGQHKRKHRLPNLICHFCGKEYPNKESITRHLFTKHVTSEPKFECQICHKKYQLQFLLKSHMWTVHREKKRSITCELCGKQFYTKFHLEKHMLSHTDKSERLESRKQCSHCGEWLLTKSGIFYHKQLHTSGVQKCEHCNIELPNRPSLLGHIRKHHRPHKFKCSYCQKTYASRADMRRHEESHTRNNVYSCEFCQSSFTVHSSLQTHLRRNHQEELKLKRQAKQLT